MGLTASELARKTALHARNRLGFGPRPGDVEKVLDQGIENYVNEQLEPRPDAALESRLAPFANTRRAHDKAKAAGISVRMARECRDRGLALVVAEELDRLAGLAEVIFVDFDIDVIDRSQWPASPGARPGGRLRRRRMRPQLPDGRTARGECIW